MRILHIFDHSIPLHSGYAFRSIALLAEQRRMGWETLQLTTPKQGKCASLEELVDGWTFLRTDIDQTSVRGAGLYFRQMAATQARIEEIIAGYRPDILHPHSPVLNAIPALRAGKRLGLPVVYEVRASWEDAAVDHGVTVEGSLRYKLSRFLETWALRRADAITTICEGLRTDILARRGIRPEKVAVIPNAVDVSSFAYAPVKDADLNRALGLDGAIVLGFAGSFYGYEGLDILLDAFAQLVPRYPFLKVLLVGGGPQDAALREQAVRLGLSDRIVFSGRVPHSDVQRYYGQIDLLCYPRKSMRLTDVVTPLKPLEAMAQGKILVASDVGGHKELIRDGETGVLFRAGDPAALAQAIDRLLSVPREQWESMRRAGREYVESERTWERSAANYRAVYRSVLPPARQFLVDPS